MIFPRLQSLTNNHSCGNVEVELQCLPLYLMKLTLTPWKPSVPILNIQGNSRSISSQHERPMLERQERNEGKGGGGREREQSMTERDTETDQKKGNHARHIGSN